MKHHYPQRSGRSPRVVSTSRRRFLQASAAALSGLALSNCRRGISNVQGGSASNGGAANAQSETLHIYTWADYTDEGLAQLFTERTGIEVVIDIYDSNEVMLAKMQAGGGDAYSIIYPSDYMVEEMTGLGMLSELDHSKIQGLDTLFPQWQNPSYDPGNTHSIPMSWGTTGLLYNTSQLEFAPEDWSDLWDNQEQLFRRMTLLDDVREVMGAVLRSLGYSYNSTNPAEIEEAYQRLVDLKPALASFQSFGWEDQLLSGDLALVMAYSVDAIAATLEDPSLVYVVPSSGSSLWTDTMVIPKSAPNPEAAYAWMNLFYEPEVSAEVVSRLFFATPIKPAFELLPEDLKANDDLFPPEEILAKCEGIAPVGEAIELYDRLWTELASA